VEFKAFFDAIAADWVALMSGIGSIVLLLLGLTVYYKKPLPRWTIIAVGVICFVFAAVRIWTTEHRLRVATDAKFTELTVPQLHVSIDEMGVGNFTPTPIKGSDRRPLPPPFIGATLTASVTNTGAPSIAEAWTLVIELTDGQKTPVLLPEFVNPQGTYLSHGDLSGGPDWQVSPSDALYLKAMSKPIERGMKVRGFLMFRVEHYTQAELTKKGTRFILSCVDVAGKQATGELAFKGAPEPHHYLPGMEPVVPK